jgi:hypothetical protein
VNELVVALMAWAVLLTGSPKPATLPTVTLVPHVHLEELACGQPCPVLGLYTFGEVVYLDDQLDPDADVYARSILLHELVHYLQQVSGHYEGMSVCQAAILRERQAYQVQNEYLVRHSATPRAGSTLHNVHCLTAAVDE